MFMQLCLPKQINIFYTNNLSFHNITQHYVGPQNITRMACSKSCAWRLRFKLSSQHPIVIFQGPTSMSDVVSLLWKLHLLVPF